METAALPSYSGEGGKYSLPSLLESFRRKSAKEN